MTNTIVARDLVKTYPGDVRALDGLSFNVEAGTVYALVGPNGAGKSTTVKILTTLSRPNAGEAEVAGIDVLRKPDAVRRAIGCVAQKSGIDVAATGRENLILQGHIYGMRGAELKRRANDLLVNAGLGDAADRVARTYSGGMQRKLDVAMGLIHRPEVLFLDEPTTGLDPQARLDMWGEITRLAHDEGLTILLTTHYLDEADRLANKLAVVDLGKVVAEGSPDELKGELRGDAIHVELEQSCDAVEGGGDAVTACLHGVAVEGIRDVVVEGRMLRARADNGARMVPALLAALEAAGIGVSSVTVARPSLDDVYLRYAGRAFSEADQEVTR
jgi:ABC-2 type transport system ATP-binding protein